VIISRLAVPDFAPDRFAERIANQRLDLIPAATRALYCVAGRGGAGRAPKQGAGLCPTL
jgi:hypothetical protein